MSRFLKGFVLSIALGMPVALVGCGADKKEGDKMGGDKMGGDKGKMDDKDKMKGKM